MSPKISANYVLREEIISDDHVGAGWARGADADADIACLGPGVAFRHMRGALDVARQNVPD